MSNLSFEGLFGLLSSMQADGKLTDAEAQDPTEFAALTAITENVLAVDLTVWTGPFTDKDRRRATGADAEELSTLLRSPHPRYGLTETLTCLIREMTRGGRAVIVMLDIGGNPVSSANERPFSLRVYGRDEAKPYARNGVWSGWRIERTGRKPMIVLPHAGIELRRPRRGSEMEGLGTDDVLRVPHDIGWSLRRYLSAWFKNGAQPGGVIEMEGLPAPETIEDLKRQWGDRHEGADKANRTAVLTDGATYKQISTTHVDMALMPIATWQRHEVLSAHRVPESEIGFSSEQTYSNGISANEGFWSQTLFPLMRRIEEALNNPRNGLSRRYGRAIYTGFDRARVERVLSCTSAKLEQLDKAVRNGIPRNTATEQLGIDVPPVEGGDVALVMANMIPLTAVATSPAAVGRGSNGDSPSPGGRTRALTAGGTRATERVAAVKRIDRLKRSEERRYTIAVRRLLREMAASQIARIDEMDTSRSIAEGPGDIVIDGLTEADRWVQWMTPLYEASIAEAAETVGAELGRGLLTFEIEHPAVEAVVREKTFQIRRVAERITEELRSEITESVNAAETVVELKKRVQSVMQVESKRAHVIAQQESAEAIEGGRTLAMKLEGVRRHEWSTAGDEKVRDSHAMVDGEVVKVGEPFGNGLRYPHDPQAPAREVVACRCTTLALPEDIEE